MRCREAGDTLYNYHACMHLCSLPFRKERKRKLGEERREGKQTERERKGGRARCVISPRGGASSVFLAGPLPSSWRGTFLTQS